MADNDMREILECASDDELYEETKRRRDAQIAAAHREQKRRIEIETAAAWEKARLRTHEMGLGLGPEQMRKLSDVFFDLHEDLGNLGY